MVLTSPLTPGRQLVTVNGAVALKLNAFRRVNTVPPWLILVNEPTAYIRLPHCTICLTCSTVPFGASCGVPLAGTAETVLCWSASAGTGEPATVTASVPAMLTSVPVTRRLLIMPFPPNSPSLSHCVTLECRAPPRCAWLSPVNDMALGDRVRRGDVVYGGWSVLGGPVSARALAAAGLDYVVVDLQHGAATERDLPAITSAIGLAGAAPLARVRYAHPADIGRALDLGCQGVIVPNVDSAAQAAEVGGRRAGRRQQAAVHHHGRVGERRRRARGHPGHRRRRRDLRRPEGPVAGPGLRPRSARPGAPPGA